MTKRTRPETYEAKNADGRSVRVTVPGAEEPAAQVALRDRVRLLISRVRSAAALADSLEGAWAAADRPAEGRALVGIVKEAARMADESRGILAEMGLEQDAVDDVVGIDQACPRCGCRRMDDLAWDEAGQYVTCEVCGQEYRPLVR